MDFSTAIGVVRDSSGLAGSQITVGSSRQAYHCGPKIESAKRMGIVVVSDIYGFEPTHCKMICDELALKGFEAVMPDAFTDVKPWPMTNESVTGEEFRKFWLGITSDDYWTQFQSILEDSITFLRQFGCVKFGIIGFGWGGLAAETAAKGGQFAAAVSACGSGHTVDRYREVKSSILYISVPDDTSFPKESQDEMLAVGARVHIYDGMQPEFMVRGDRSNSTVTSAIEQAMDSVTELFDFALMRKPMMRKVGALHPNSRGVTCVVKILGEIFEVEATKKSDDCATFHEVLCGDDTGQVVLSVKEGSVEGLRKDTVLLVRNVSVNIVQGYIRLVVDKWSKLDFDVNESITEIGYYNISKIEYELIRSH